MRPAFHGKGWWLSALLLCLLVGLAVSWWIGGQLVAPVPHAVPLPGDFSAQALTIESPNGSLAAWWAPAGPGAPVVVLLHAVRGDRFTMLSRARLLGAHGISTLLIDMQAHGESPGTAITMGWREADDARAALAWARRMAPGSRVGAIGCSLGGAAILLGRQPAGYDAVVLEAVYPRLARAVENRIRLRVGPLAPALAPLLLAQIKLRLGIDAASLAPIEGIARLGAPVLVAAGSEDRHTTLAESRELFAAAREPRRLWIVRGAAHQDFLAFDPAGYEREILSFVLKYLRRA
jgi:fermentation-respiration switch protein FrsA (DUF1100 family)